MGTHVTPHVTCTLLLVKREQAGGAACAYPLFHKNHAHKSDAVSCTSTCLSALTHGCVIACARTRVYLTDEHQIGRFASRSSQTHAHAIAGVKGLVTLHTGGPRGMDGGYANQSPKR